MPVTAHQRVADLKHPGACRKHQQLLRCWRIRLVPFAGRRAVRHMMLPLTLTYVRGEQRRTTVRRSARIKGSKQGTCPKQGSRRSCPTPAPGALVYSCAVRLSLVTIYYAVFLFDCARHSARSKRSRLSPTRCSVLVRLARAYECAARAACRTPHSRPRPPSRRAAPETRAPGSSGVSKELDVETPHRSA